MTELKSNKQSILLIPTKLMKTSWICVAIPLIKKRPPPPLAVPYYCENKTKMSEKKRMAFQTGQKPNCFPPCVEYHQNAGEIVFPINCND